MNRIAEAPRLLQIWKSFQALPRWVQVWVGLILVPANAVPFALLDTWTGRIAAAAALVVVATNLPIMWIERGMSRLMSVPHLLIWGPLQIALLLRWTERVGPLPRADCERALIMLLVVVNGISLAFDALDSWRWFRGDRDVPGQGQEAG